MENVHIVGARGKNLFPIRPEPFEFAGHLPDGYVAINIDYRFHHAIAEFEQRLNTLLKTVAPTVATELVSRRCKEHLITELRSGGLRLPVLVDVDIPHEELQYVLFLPRGSKEWWVGSLWNRCMEVWQHHCKSTDVCFDVRRILRRLDGCPLWNFGSSDWDRTGRELVCEMILALIADCRTACSELVEKLRVEIARPVEIMSLEAAIRPVIYARAQILCSLVRKVSILPTKILLQASVENWMPLHQAFASKRRNQALCTYPGLAAMAEYELEDKTPHGINVASKVLEAVDTGASPVEALRLYLGAKTWVAKAILEMPKFEQFHSPGLLPALRDFLGRLGHGTYHQFQTMIPLCELMIETGTNWWPQLARSIREFGYPKTALALTQHSLTHLHQYLQWINLLDLHIQGENQELLLAPYWELRIPLHSLLDASTHWRRAFEQSVLPNSVEHVDLSCAVWPALFHGPITVGEFVAMSICSTMDAKRESVDMHHCLSSQLIPYVTGRYHVVSIRSQDWQPAATIELELISHKQGRCARFLVHQTQTLDRKKQDLMEQVASKLIALLTKHPEWVNSELLTHKYPRVPLAEQGDQRHQQIKIFLKAVSVDPERSLRKIKPALHPTRNRRHLERRILEAAALLS